jgi:DNA-binding response OmpR family regulator
MTKRVLLCDDDCPILRAAEFKISRAGYEVRCAGDGQAAWELIQQWLPDILVTDLQMPRLDGFGLSQKLRESPATRNLPILMLTAKGFEATHRKMAAECGVLAVLPKPFSPRELLQCINQALGTGEVNPSEGISIAVPAKELSAAEAAPLPLSLPSVAGELFPHAEY